MEVHNGRVRDARANERAAEFAQAFGVPGVASSDAHTTGEVGSCATILAGGHPLGGGPAGGAAGAAPPVGATRSSRTPIPVGSADVPRLSGGSRLSGYQEDGPGPRAHVLVDLPHRHQAGAHPLDRRGRGHILGLPEADDRDLEGIELWWWDQSGADVGVRARRPRSVSRPGRNRQTRTLAARYAG